jgi:hypothetical protein
MNDQNQNEKQEFQPSDRYPVKPVSRQHKREMDREYIRKITGSKPNHKLIKKLKI